MDFSGVNYASFWAQVPGQPMIISTAPSHVYHSEKEVWMMLNGQPGLSSIALPNWPTGQGVGMPRQTADAAAAAGSMILGVYTERQPCGTCSPFLNDALPNGTLVGWHFPWPSAETKKHKHDDDSMVVTGLMAISRSTTYDKGSKDYQRADRIEGNKGLGSAMKGMRKTTLGLQHQIPWLINTGRK